MKILLIFILMLNLPGPIWGQDYFTDLTSSSTPILFNGTDKALFSATLNAGDNSVKANFFRHYWTNSKSYNPLGVPRQKYFWGWGLNTKVKTEDGLGALFSSGKFTPGFSAGAYLSFSKMHWYYGNAKKEIFAHWALILSGQLSTNNFQFYHPNNLFSTQLSDTTFNGRSVALSFVNMKFVGKDNVFFGISITGSRINNYSKLDKVEIKDDSIFTNGLGSSRTATKINDKGNIYAVGNYEQYNNFTIRPNISYIPAALSYFVAFIIYPSVDFSKVFKPKYNLGVSFAHLKQGSPSISDAALFLELNDMTNVSGKDDPFFKRTFKFGISTTLNIFTSSK